MFEWFVADVENVYTFWWHLNKINTLTHALWATQPSNRLQQRWQMHFCYLKKVSCSQYDSTLYDRSFSTLCAFWSLPTILGSFFHSRSDRVSFAPPVAWDASLSFCKCPNIWCHFTCWRIVWWDYHASRGGICDSWRICVSCCSILQWCCRGTGMRGNFINGKCTSHRRMCFRPLWPFSLSLVYWIWVDLCWWSFPREWLTWGLDLHDLEGIQFQVDLAVKIMADIRWSFCTDGWGYRRALNKWENK